MFMIVLHQSMVTFRGDDFSRDLQNELRTCILNMLNQNFCHSSFAQDEDADQSGHG